MDLIEFTVFYSLFSTYIFVSDSFNNLAEKARSADAKGLEGLLVFISLFIWPAYLLLDLAGAHHV